jgi:hypothetical protein
MTADSLEKAMQESISLQPYVKSVSVTIDRKMLQDNVFGYGELAGKMISAHVVIDSQGEVISAQLKYDRENDYPLMQLL